jgi:hypothetical protein
MCRSFGQYLDRITLLTVVTIVKCLLAPSAQVDRIHPGSQRPAALPRASDRSHLLHDAHEIRTFAERRAHREPLDDWSGTALGGTLVRVGLDRTEHFGMQRRLHE